MEHSRNSSRAVAIPTGLRFPEGRVALDDGAILLVEVAGGTLMRIDPSGSVSCVGVPMVRRYQICDSLAVELSRRVYAATLGSGS